MYAENIKIEFKESDKLGDNDLELKGGSLAAGEDLRKPAQQIPEQQADDINDGSRSEDIDLEPEGTMPMTKRQKLHEDHV